ncbi:MAG: Ni/Fe hydrogenase subunit alpha [archaeon]
MAKTIKLDYITKVEGHADLSIKIRKDKKPDVNLKIFEGARFFEGLVTNMDFKRVPLVTSRICGVCSQAHLLASYTALEQAQNIKISNQTSSLRKLLLYASIIQSHALHLFFMSLPDYFNIENAIELAKKRPEIVKLAISIKSLANKILEIVGGRQIHSVTTRFGGFTKLPEKKELDELLSLLKKEKPKMLREFKQIFSTLKQPDFKTDNDFLALCSDEYAPFKGTLKTLSSITFEIGDYRTYLKENIRTYSSSKFVSMKNKSFITGALARVNLKSEFLSKDAKKLLKTTKLELPNRNPFNNNLCQAIEIIHFFDECITILQKLRVRQEKEVEVKLKEPTIGVSAIEVPRGVLFHEYTLRADGSISACNIITPTTQNVLSIENDIKKMLPQILNKPKKEITDMIERLIRAYDPCISCSTHFLNVKWT